MNNVTICSRYPVGRQAATEAGTHTLIPSVKITQKLVVMTCCRPMGTLVLPVSRCFPWAAGGSAGRGDFTGADNRPAQLRRAPTSLAHEHRMFSKLTFRIK